MAVQCHIFWVQWAKFEEEVVSKTFAKHGLCFNVEMSLGHVGNDRSYPYIKVASMIKALDENGKLYKLIGLGPNMNTLASCSDYLLDFWSKYKLMNGGHEVFRLAESGHLQLQNCLPVLIHGDEGTTYKKDGCLVVSFHSLIGQGTASNKMGPVRDDNGDATVHTNFVGHAFQTRFLLGALLKEFWLSVTSSIYFVLLGLVVMLCYVDQYPKQNYVLTSYYQPVMPRRTTERTALHISTFWNL